MPTRDDMDGGQQPQAAQHESSKAGGKTNAQEALKQGLELQNTGRVAEAAEIFRGVIEADPDNAEALYFLGRIQFTTGAKVEGAKLIHRALLLRPRNANLHLEVGLAMRELGRAEDAVRFLRNAVAIKADLSRAWTELGHLLLAGRKIDEARKAYERALRSKHNDVPTLLGLGDIENILGNAEAAMEIYKRILAVDPKNARANLNLGALLDNDGKRDEAIDFYRRALEIQPDYHMALVNLGKALCERGLFEEAAEHLKRADALQPDHAKTLLYLGWAYRALEDRQGAMEKLRRAGELSVNDPTALFHIAELQRQAGLNEDAIAVYRRVLVLKPDAPEALLNLGNVLFDSGRLDEAKNFYRRAIEQRPEYAEAHSNLGNVLQEQGQLSEAAECFKRALEYKPDFAIAYSNLLYCQQYDHSITPEQQYEDHLEYSRRYVEPLAGEIRPHSNDPDPERPLRVGYISGSFNRHPVGFLAEPALRHADRKNFSLYCYYNDRRSDPITSAFIAHADKFQTIIGMNDEKVAELIRSDGIDILVDLAGHGGGCRLLVLARKPAPVQVKWVGGLFNTTGVRTIDYLITDAIESPEGSDKWFVEELVRLPDGYVCYEPPEYAPAVGPLPALERGHVTFGSFNNLAKITPETVRVWADILTKVPGARLVMKTKSLAAADVRDTYHKLFEEYGVERARVDLRPPSQHRKLFETYNEIDIALDSFPYSGGLTTCEALWMGVPVLSMPGETFAARHAATHLANVGLDDWIVGSVDDYVAEAVKRAGDLDALATLRAGLRDRMSASPLCDGPRFARHLENAYRTMWRRWCADKTGAEQGKDRKSASGKTSTPKTAAAPKTKSKTRPKAKPASQSKTRTKKKAAGKTKAGKTAGTTAKT